MVEMTIFEDLLVCVVWSLEMFVCLSGIEAFCAVRWKRQDESDDGRIRGSRQDSLYRTPITPAAGTAFAIVDTRFEMIVSMIASAAA